MREWGSKWQSWDSEYEPRPPDACSPVLSSSQLPPCYAHTQKVVQTENMKIMFMKGYAMK